MPLGESAETTVERLGRAVREAANSGYQLEGGAFKLLKDAAEKFDIGELIRRIVEKCNALPERPIFITASMVESTLEEVLPKTQELVIGTGQPEFRAYASEVESQVRVLDDYTDKLSSKGTVDDFLRCFRSRFARIKRLFRQRLDVRDAISIADAMVAPPNAEVRIVCMVTEKREIRKRLLIQIEDEYDRATVIVPPNADTSVVEKSQRILLDQVICVCAKRVRDDQFTATDFIWPDIPERRFTGPTDPVYAALISDLHVGSKTFLEERLQRFVSWLKGEVGNNRQRELAGRVKYVVIAGDLVDGVGIYPNQEHELRITDVHVQYQEVAKYLEQIPEYVEVIIIPGNHDATRQALPQPSISREYGSPLYASGRFTMLSNPARVVLHGVELLLYHGRSLDDVISSVPGVSYRDLGTTAHRAMELLLKSRHLAPTYGQRTPLAPEPEDFLVIENPPDIFQCGHVHVVDYELYRGTLILNSGAWQNQTEYQRKMGLVPQPGVAPIVDLQTLQVFPMDFTAL
jgi:DNA polymerase II small subunit